MREIKYDLPESLTNETYYQVTRKEQAAVRHSLWKKIQAKGVRQLSKQEIVSILETIKQEEYESILKRAFELFKVKLQEGETPKYIIQKAFLNISTGPIISE